MSSWTYKPPLPGSECKALSDLKETFSNGCVVQTDKGVYKIYINKDKDSITVTLIGRKNYNEHNSYRR